MSSFIPMMSNQLRHFMEDLPSYVNKVQMETSSFIDHNPWLILIKGKYRACLSNISSQAALMLKNFQRMF